MLVDNHNRPLLGAALFMGAWLSLAAPAAASSGGDHVDARPVSAAVDALPFWRDEATAARSERRPRALGRAPYLCTPSGFGRIARCYLRGQLTAN